MPEELVVGILRPPVIIDGARLPVGGARHDQPMDGLEAPLLFHEPVGQPFEEFWMRGLVSLRAEIVWCGDDAAAEVVVPEPVDDHAGGERAGAPVHVGEKCRESEA